MLSLISILTLFSLPFLAICQSNSDGYTGYKLDVRDDGDSAAVLFETDNTRTSNVSALVPQPDVLLNASVHVGEISIGVDNLTAKINLDAQVLNLLQFNAGVDLSIDKVTLLIQNVTAKVFLEVRLANLVNMIDDVLASIDLNPIIAELGSGVGTILNDTAGLVGGVTGGNKTSTITKRETDLHQWDLYNNILYAVNNFEGNTNKREVLSQNGDIVQQILDDHGSISSSSVVGNYQQNMQFNGFSKTATFDGEEVTEEEWLYTPFPGLYSVAGIFKSKTGQVVGTKLVAEVQGGGSADIGNEQG